MMHFLTESSSHLRRLLINRGASIGSHQNLQFVDGEFAYHLNEDVRRQKVRVVGSVLSDPTSLFDLIATFRLLKENHSQNPSLLIPYLGYARQDAMQGGEVAIGIVVAELLRNLNPSKIAVLDIHSQVILEALGAKAEQISPYPLLLERLNKDAAEIEVIVAPDEGTIERANRLAQSFEQVPEVVHVEKVRPKPNVAVAKRLIGKVKGKHVLIVDDIVDTGGTISEAVRLVSKEGAQSIRVFVTHGLFTGDARDKLSRLPVTAFYTTNSLPQPRGGEIQVLDISSLLLSIE